MASNPQTDEELLADFDAYMDSSSSTSPAVDHLAELFPSVDRETLVSTLDTHNGNLEAAASSLLAQDNAQNALERDERIARALQSREFAHARHRTAPSRSHVLSGNDLQHMATVLRDIVVPALHAHFKELTFQDVREDTPGYLWVMNNVRVVALSLPRENIIVTVLTDTIRIQIVNMFLQLDVGRWRYESKGFLAWSDTGKAEVSVNGLSANAILKPRSNPDNGRTHLKITECDARIEGAVRFKAEQTSADWAYNTIAVLLKPLISSYIKDAVADLFRVTLAGQLRAWTYTIGDGSSPVSTTHQESSVQTSTEEPTTAAT